jgi:hypothetical protein
MGEGGGGAEKSTYEHKQWVCFSVDPSLRRQARADQLAEPKHAPVRGTVEEPESRRRHLQNTKRQGKGTIEERLSQCAFVDVQNRAATAQ